MRLAIFASGEGTTLAAIIEAVDRGDLEAELSIALTNNADCGARARAMDAGIRTVHMSRTTHPDPADLDGAIRQVLDASKVDVVVLAGYMRKIGPKTLQRYAGRIINTHPSLLPKHGGQGMYGRRVHEAVLESGDAESGVSVHLVDSEYDSGRVIAQAKVAVDPGETVDTLEAKVRSLERQFLCEVLRDIAQGKITLLV